MKPTLLALIVLTGFAIGYALIPYLFKKPTRTKVKCFLGFHGMDTAAISDDGNVITQRCLYCDKIINMYERDENNAIRRVR